MNKRAVIQMIVVISFLSFGAFVAESRPDRTATGGWNGQEYRQLLKYIVKNNQGEYLGRMEDLVIQPDGRILFAIITRPGVLGIRGQPVAIPFETLSFAGEKDELVLDMSREQFASVPNFTNMSDLENRTWAGSIYRKFGVQPYWTERGHNASVNSLR